LSARFSTKSGDEKSPLALFFGIVSLGTIKREWVAVHVGKGREEMNVPLCLFFSEFAIQRRAWRE
jgi:hypothetical protein